MHLELAAEECPNLLGREAVRPLRAWLEVAKAFQEEIAARLEQTGNRGDVVRSAFRRQDVKAAPVEDQVEQSRKSGGQNIVLLPVHTNSLCLRLLACEPDGRLRDVRSRHLEAALSKPH